MEHLQQHLLFIEKELNKANNRVIFLEIIITCLIIGFLLVSALVVPASLKSYGILNSAYPSEVSFSSGEGDTWEAAIEDAERNLKEKRGY